MCTTISIFLIVSGAVTGTFGRRKADHDDSQVHASYQRFLPFS